MRRLLVAVLLVTACSPAPEVGELDAEAPDADLGSDAGTRDVASDSTSVPDAGPTVEVILGDSEVSFAEGVSQEVEFIVPTGTEALFVTVFGRPGRFYSISSWRAPSGEEPVPSDWVNRDPETPTACVTCPHRLVSAESVFASLMPNGTSVTVEPGRHVIRLYGYEKPGFSFAPLDGSRAVVRVVGRTGRAGPRGTLDLNLHFTGARGIDAQSATTEPIIQDALSEVERLFGQVGIGLGEVRYYDVPSEYEVIETAIAPNGDLQELFALSESSEPGAVNIFFVEELLSGVGGPGTYLGLSGGIPGPIEQGTPRSGVALAFHRTPTANLPLHKVMAHEICHYLGLLHTTERNGVQDRIEDTAPADDTLLMYHYGQGERITEQQGEIVRRNPLIRVEVLR